jgi:DNA polymerase III gamma/tau subunit
VARRPEEEANHWPGFVDALSTIVMVVTFLLIILGIVIFVISKNISAELAKAAEEVEQAQKALHKAQDKANDANKKARSAARAQARAQAAAAQAQAQAKKSEQEQDENQEKSQNQSQRSSVKKRKTASTFRTQFSEELTQNDEVESDDKHTVRTRKTQNTKQIIISTTEQEKNLRDVKVTSSQALLTLVFTGGMKISDEVSSEIQNYLKANTRADKKEKYEVRAFFNTEKGSISEAKRLAYYRALATRNQLLSLGVKSADIAIKVSISEQDGDGGKVNIYLK